MLLIIGYKLWIENGVVVEYVVEVFDIFFMLFDVVGVVLKDFVSNI